MTWGLSGSEFELLRARGLCPRGQEHPRWRAPSLGTAACLTALPEARGRWQLSCSGGGLAVGPEPWSQLSRDKHAGARLASSPHILPRITTPYPNSRPVLSLGLWRHGKNNNFPLRGEILPFEPKNNEICEKRGI